MPRSFYEFINPLITQYIGAARECFRLRMKEWKLDIFDKEANEVIGGLLARQLSLATTIAKCPPAWNMHLLPVVLRCMADVYITFCWVIKDVQPRSRAFIEYGLGQEKLAIERYRECLSQDDEPDPTAEKMISAREKVLDAERYRFLIPVELGSWSGLTLRDMAIEVGEKQFYDLVFTQFSAAVHSTWQHIWQANLYPCSNPLHMGHRVPGDPELPIDIYTFTMSAKYLCKTFAKFDKVILQEPRHLDAYKCYDFLCQSFESCYARANDSGKTTRSSRGKNESKTSPTQILIKRTGKIFRKVPKISD